MVAGNVGGIRIQIDDGESGYLVDNAEEAGPGGLPNCSPTRNSAPGLAVKPGKRCGERFLIPRLLYDYLEAAEQAHGVE